MRFPLSLVFSRINNFSSLKLFLIWCLPNPSPASLLLSGHPPGTQCLSYPVVPRTELGTPAVASPGPSKGHDLCPVLAGHTVCDSGQERANSSLILLLFFNRTSDSLKWRHLCINRMVSVLWTQAYPQALEAAMSFCRCLLELGRNPLEIGLERWMAPGSPSCRANLGTSKIWGCLGMPWITQAGEKSGGCRQAQWFPNCNYTCKRKWNVCVSHTGGGLLTLSFSAAGVCQGRSWPWTLSRLKGFADKWKGRALTLDSLSMLVGK